VFVHHELFGSEKAVKCVSDDVHTVGNYCGIMNAYVFSDGCDCLTEVGVVV
jgi:hypothetical protein